MVTFIHLKIPYMIKMAIKTIIDSIKCSNIQHYYII
jgi:hypothetical protein